MNNELTLNHVNVIFAELVDNGYGRNITIDATDPTIKKAITDWVAANKIKGGTPKFKDYTDKEGKTTTQYQFTISKYTAFGGKNNEDENALGYGAVITLIARPFTYDNKFGKGVSASLKAVYIIEPRKNNALDTISE